MKDFAHTLIAAAIIFLVLAALMGISGIPHESVPMALLSIACSSLSNALRRYE